MNHRTRILSRNEEHPIVAELYDALRGDHPHFRLVVEEGDLDEWETLLLVDDAEVEVALLNRLTVYPASLGEDELADLEEDLHGCQPESAVEWLREFMAEVKTVYVFEHLQGAHTIEGGNALHALRTALWERGDAILQADGEGFTNEEGFHILWQFSDEIFGLWSMAVLHDGVWQSFRMDLGDPGHRAAFLAGEVPEDVTVIRSQG